MDKELLLAKATEAIKNGENGQARSLLDELVMKDPKNEQAWMLLSEVVPNLNEIIDCLQQVLAINPGNKVGIERLNQLSPQSLPAIPLSSKTVSQILDDASVSENPITKDQVQIPVGISLPKSLEAQDQDQDGSDAFRPDKNRLIDLIKLDPQNEEAWIQLSKILDDPEQIANCLRHVILINPYNTVAKLRLSALEK